MWDPNSLGATTSRPTLLLFMGMDWLLNSFLHIELGLVQMLMYSLYIFLSLYFFEKFFLLYFRIQNSSFASIAAAILYTFNVFIIERNFYPSIRWIVLALPVLGYFLTTYLRSERKLIFKNISLSVVIAFLLSLLIINPPLVVISAFFCLIIFFTRRRSVEKATLFASFIFTGC